MPRPADVLAARGITAETVESKLGELVRVEPANVPDAVAVLWELGYDFLVDLFGTDTGDGIDFTYHLRRFAAHEDLYVRALVPYDGKVGSVWRSFPASLYAERETAELFGIPVFGLPNPKRLLTTEGTEPLLRKSVPIRTAEEVQRPYE